MRWLVAAVVMVVLAGCSQDALMEKFSSPEDQATARGYIDLLRARKFADIDAAVDESIRNALTDDKLAAMAELIPPGDPTSVKVVGAQSFVGSDGHRVNTTFEFDFAGKWVVINVAILNKAGRKTIIGFNIYPQSMSLEEKNRFDLVGKSGLQYATLAAALVVSLLSLYALVVCIRSKIAGRKWAWILFILVGFGRFAINWSTGQWGFAPLTVQLFSVSALAPLYGPWVVSVSIPLGAIVFLLRRRRLIVQP